MAQHTLIDRHLIASPSYKQGRVVRLVISKRAHDFSLPSQPESEWRYNSSIPTRPDSVLVAILTRIAYVG